MSRTTIYAYGFDGSQKAVEAAVADIGPTAFDTVILPFLHVHSGGALFFNDKPVDQLWSGLAGALAQLKTGFPVQKQLVLSIGPFQSDFDNIAPNVDAYVADIAAFATGLGIDGIDLDYEGEQDDTHLDLLAAIVARYVQVAPGAIVTAAPYYGQDFWAGPGGLLSRTAVSGGNLMSWFNVQFYAGDDNVPPGEYLDVFESWASPIGSDGNGVADAATFVVPGCNGTVGFTPADISAGLGNVRNKYPDIGGGFVWNYKGLDAPVEEWGQAISTAAGG